MSFFDIRSATANDVFTVVVFAAFRLRALFFWCENIDGCAGAYASWRPFDKATLVCARQNTDTVFAFVDVSGHGVVDIAFAAIEIVVIQKRIKAGQNFKKR